MVAGKVDGQILFGARSEKPKFLFDARGEKRKIYLVPNDSYEKLYLAVKGFKCIYTRRFLYVDCTLLSMIKFVLHDGYPADSPQDFIDAQIFPQRFFSKLMDSLLKNLVFNRQNKNLWVPSP